MAFSNKGLVSALVLLLPLLLPTEADYVTWAQCTRYGRRERVREYPTDTEATWLNLAMCRIKNVTLTDINGLPNLVFLFLNYNNIENIDTAAFRSLPNLTKVELGYNKLKQAPVFVENSCPSLTELFLWNNQIENINNGETFSPCAKLERLFLSNNQIEHLHPDLFKSLPELKELYLYDNKINFIPEQMFESSKLQRLDLHENRLSYLPANFVGKLPSLSQFDFSDNPWECECFLELIEEVKKVPKLTYNEGTRPECVNNSTKSCNRRSSSHGVFTRLG